jgi:cell division protease FtsH
MSRRIAVDHFEARHGVEGKEYSQDMSRRIDEEVSKIMNTGLQRANEVLTAHRKVLEAIANKLIEVETLEQEEYEKIIISHGIMPKKKEEVKPTLEIAG